MLSLLFFGPAVLCFTIILTTILLKVYRECTPDLSDAKPSWVENWLAVFTVASCLVTSLGIGIKLANYLFG